MLKSIFSLALIMSLNNLYQAAIHKKIKGYDVSTSVQNLKIGSYYFQTKLKCLSVCSKVTNCAVFVFDSGNRCILYRNIAIKFLMATNNTNLDLYYSARLSIAYYNRKTSNYNGLIHYWPLNGINDDLIGNSHLSSIGDKNYVLDPYGNTVVFLNQTYYQLPANVYFDGSFTITAWFRTDTITRLERLIDCGNGEYSDNIVLTLTTDISFSLCLFIFSGSSSNMIQSSSYLPGKWYFLAATYNGTHGAIYLNGSKVAEGVLHMPRNITRTSCYIGASNWAGDLLIEAYLGDIKLYNRCLSQNEIINEFN